MIEAAINPDAAQKLGEFTEQFKPAFPVGLLNPAIVSEYAQFTPMMRPTVPIIFFIDRGFNIRAQYMGSDDIFNVGDMGANIRREIDKLVNEKAPALKKAAPARKK